MIIATNLDRDDPRPLVQNFLKNYKKAYGEDADMVGASSYDAFMILVKAIEKAGTDPKAIQKALLETKDYNGLTGKISRFCPRRGSQTGSDSGSQRRSIPSDGSD